MSITLKDGTTQILDSSEIETFLQNYYTQIQATETKISNTEASLQTEKENLQNLYAQNLLNPGETYQSDINESETAISNYENILQIEKERLKGLDSVLKESAFQTLIQDYSAQVRADVATFKNSDEKNIWEQIAQLRDQQLALLEELNTSRGQVSSEIFKFNQICLKAGRKDLSTDAGFFEDTHGINPISEESGMIFPYTSTNISNLPMKFKEAQRGVRRN